jgi:hypothetical protein
LASNASAKAMRASSGRRGCSNSALSASTSELDVLSCEIQATASTLPGWTRKNAARPSAAPRGMPLRAKKTNSSVEPSACIKTPNRWCPSTSGPNHCQANACRVSWTGAQFSTSPTTMLVGLQISIQFSSVSCWM